MIRLNPLRFIGEKSAIIRQISAIRVPIVAPKLSTTSSRINQPKRLFFMIKTIFSVLSMCVLLSSCKKSESTTDPNASCVLQEGTKLLVLPNNAELQVPLCISLETLQGIDTYVGRLISSDLEVEVSYDIGMLAGNYVDASHPDRLVEQSINEEFWYVRNDADWGTVFTFPNDGPANFTIADDNFDTVFAMLKTYQSQ